MINDLLDLSKIEAGKMELYPELFDVSSVIENAVGIIAPLAARKKIDVNLDLKRKNFEITADKRKFQQILYNLLSNAIKFTEEEGAVTVKFLDRKDRVEVSVRDNGVGIPAEYHKKIFEKFQQAENPVSKKIGSTGLGLTITKELIEMHGGDIRVESEAGKGAEFIFTLPVTPSSRP